MLAYKIQLSNSSHYSPKIALDQATQTGENCHHIRTIVASVPATFRANRTVYQTEVRALSQYRPMHRGAGIPAVTAFSFDKLARQLTKGVTAEISA